MDKFQDMQMHADSFAKCKGISIADYSGFTGFGCIEFLLQNSKSDIMTRIDLSDMEKYQFDYDEMREEFSDFTETLSNVTKIIPLFPNIERLELENFNNFDIFQGKNYDNIRELTLVNCTKISDCSGIFSKITKLTLQRCNIGYIPLSIYNIPSLKKIKIKNTQMLTLFPYLRVGLKHIFHRSNVKYPNEYNSESKRINGHNIIIRKKPGRTEILVL